ncbi:uncharacterized protein LOC105256850 [Camponotus floridanus]|uniref:uncharacterized protein LOC105256850 n=1 Tax=Camponotus floridanus TaxID=104421 RepID=UPI00059EC8B2|nr:uncharacterized protein LOC105256850 [Camponotus floridanus]
MKTANWICWLLATCICISEAKSKIRRPSSPPYASTLILKKPRPINHRISMGNTIHIGAPSRQRIPYKHTNYRIRRPTVYNVLSNNWKNQIPIRAFPLNNHAILPQHGTPTKDFYSINKIQEYSSQYKPELAILPPTHRGDIDDDKGPIHTIPAPNLGPADKPYNLPTNSGKTAHYPPYLNDLNYHTTVHNPMTATFGSTAINSSLPLQRIATNSSPLLHQYEVTENNDVALNEHQNIQPEAIHQAQNLDITRLYSSITNNPHQSSQSNELFANHAINSNAESNVQFGQSNMPMQTNLHSSLHVGFPSTVIQTPYTVQQIPANFHIGHPVSAGSPLSATQLYDLLNNFPQKFAEQYTSDQQHILQQQLGQIFQPDIVTSFSQPQMHSFNYDEQANQLQQQQILPDQDYTSESVTANHDPGSESSIDTRKQNDVHVNEEFIYSTDGIEQSENNIDNEEMTHQVNQATYFDKMADTSAISTKFYTTLPNREAAEKLAALAAAGHVNSRLINQLQKQQEEDTQKNPIPLNHKDDDDFENQQHDEHMYNQQKSHRKSQQHDHRQNFKVQDNGKLPLQITIPDEKDDYITSDEDQQSNTKRDNIDVEYEYEDGEIEDPQSTISLKTTSHNNNSYAEFGTRLYS